MVENEVRERKKKWGREKKQERKEKDKHFSYLCLEIGKTGENKKEELFCLVCKGKDKWKYISVYYFYTLRKKGEELKVMDKSII